MSESMTARQIELARHALGLPNSNAMSYRNAFVAGEGHADHPDWLEMVDNGFAVRRVQPKGFGGSDIFHLTHRAARLSLRAGESLDPEDFGQPVPA